VIKGIDITVTVFIFHLSLKLLKAVFIYLRHLKWVFIIKFISVITYFPFLFTIFNGKKKSLIVLNFIKN